MTAATAQGRTDLLGSLLKEVWQPGTALQPLCCCSSSSLCLPLSQGATLTHPFLTPLLLHKPHKTVQRIFYSNSTSIPFQPIPWTPCPTGLAGTQCHVYKFEVMAQLIANMHCNCPKENDNKPNTDNYTSPQHHPSQSTHIGYMQVRAVM